MILIDLRLANAERTCAHKMKCLKSLKTIRTPSGIPEKLQTCAILNLKQVNYFSLNLKFLKSILKTHFLDFYAKVVLKNLFKMNAYHLKKLRQNYQKVKISLRKLTL